MALLSLFQDMIEELQIKVEPEGDVEIGSYPVLKNVSIRLTDCSLWLGGRDFLSLGESSEPTLHPSPPAGSLFSQAFQPPDLLLKEQPSQVTRQRCLMGPPILAASAMFSAFVSLSLQKVELHV